MTKRMNGLGIGGHTKPNKGETDTWLTPPEIVQALGNFDLDPCCPPNMPWHNAPREYTEHGYAMRWTGRVWLNPPYSDASVWMELMSRHDCGTAILFARTETKMFFDWVWPKASAMLFIQGRLHFYRPDGTRAKGNAGGPSVLIAYGNSDAESLLAASKCGDIKGKFLRLR